VAECEEFCTIEKPAKMEGRTLTAVLAPKKSK
jgi:translation initiation factor IF-3